MFQIRRRVFETNSSSTHSICVVTDSKSRRYIPDNITFETGEFGWEFENYHDIGDKASYFYTAVCENLSREESNRVMNDVAEYLTKEYSINVRINEPKYSKWNSGKEFLDEGYIDHANDTVEFMNALIEDKELLADFLFSDDSFVATGNDNCYESERSTMEDPPTDLEYRSFYKGN